MEIVGLYEYNNVYQVVRTDDYSVCFQGRLEDCKKYLKKNLGVGC
jgi:hypothetical protein